jgi:hypothetical protein
MKADHRQGHPEVWAFLTIVTFPIVLIASELLGAGGWWPFLYAILATFSVLVLEAIVRGRLWPFEQGFVNHIGHPETPYRILVFLGATLLILETVVVVGVATDPRFDGPLLGLVIQKQCALRNASRVADSVCRFLTEPRLASGKARTTDLSEYAVLTHATKTWMPNGGFVTCSSKNMMRRVDSERNTVRELDLIHCTDWKLDNQGALQPLTQQTKYAAALLAKQANGLYTVSAWSEDPGHETWTTALGDIATVCRERVQALGILPELETALNAEALAKAQMVLKL